MAISDPQKVDYLWKKIGYAATKTDTSSIKAGFEEAIPSPLQIRADKIMVDSANIPTTIPGSTTAPVTVYPTSAPVECTVDSSATPNRSWKTNLTDWVSPEFGSTYQVKVYIHTASNAGNAASAGTLVSAAGSNNTDEWFFDYQSGVLNFIGTNLPIGIVFTGKSVYVSGARYTGAFGFSNSFSNVSLGNLYVDGNTITSTNTDGNIILNPNGTGTVQIIGDNAVGIPYGNNATRPTNVYTGYLRYNTDLVAIEYYNGTSWQNDQNISGSLSSETIYPTGASNSYTLIADATTDGVLVSINGTLQQPTTAYTVSGNVITFTETPLSSDIIEVRAIAMNLVSIPAISDGATRLTTNSTTGNITALGNLIIDPGYGIFAGNITGNTNGYAIGYRDVPQISAANVTLALTDAGKHYYSTNASPTTLTIPSNANIAFPTGTAIMIVNRGTGNITISKQVEANLYLAGNATSSNRTITSYGIASLIKVETNVWMINGTGIS